jgi:hypothetical protein
MSNINATTTETALAYPAIAVATALNDELVTAVRSAAKRKSLVLTNNDKELANTAIDIDSLAVIEILCVLDDILPFQVSECVVRAGGYKSIKDAIEQLVPMVEHEWIKHHNGGKS